MRKMTMTMNPTDSCFGYAAICKIKNQFEEEVKQ